jgi:hypothetical protein
MDIAMPLLDMPQHEAVLVEHGIAYASNAVGISDHWLFTWEMPPGVGVNLAWVSVIHPHSHFQLPVKYIAWFINLLHQLNQSTVLHA